MEFFNRKEEVLDVELTQYGKYLLSVGKFKPSYYAFFDDDVIYDLQYQGNPPNDAEAETSPTENQKDTEKRIKETARIKVQHNFYTVDKSSKQSENDTDNHGSAPDTPLVGPPIGDPESIEKLNSKIAFAYSTHFKNEYHGVKLPLGTIDYASIYSPAWQVNFMNGFLKSSVNHGGYGGNSKYGIKKVPQLEVEVTFNTSVGQNQYLDPSDNQTSRAIPGSVQPGVNNEIFENGNFIKIEEDYILLDVQEINGLFGLDKFDLEIFEIEQEGTSNENLKQLFFGTVGNGPEILFESEFDLLEDEQSGEISDKLVEYFFEITVDDEIEQVLNYNKMNVNTSVNDLEPCEDDV